MNMREHEKVLLDKDAFKVKLEMLAQSTAHTIIVDDKIILVGGSIEISEGTYDIWQIPSQHVEENLVLYSRGIKKWFDRLCDIDGVERIQTIALDDELHTRWLSFLGLEKEGTLRKYYNKTDYCMWSKINGN